MGEDMKKEKTVFSVRMLGDLTFRYGEEVFSMKCSNTSKVMQLLLILLRAGKEGISRVQLLEALYGHDETQDTKNAFRILVFRLRKLLDETIIPKDDYIYVEKGIYRFGGHLPVEIDAEIFEQRAKDAFQFEDKEKRANAIIHACEVYSGEFLSCLAEEEWVSEENIRYKELYFQCLREGCSLLRESSRFEDMLDLCNRAIKIYPYEEWQLVQIDCLLAMNRYKEALNVYEDTTTLFFEEMGLSRSEKMLDRFRTMSSQIHYSMGTLADIKNSLREKEFTPGAYYCSYPSFIDSYRIISRTIERSGQSIFLMLCTITDNRGNPIEKDAILSKQTVNLSQAIGRSLRRGDLYTRYSPNQFLILLMGINQEDCEITYQRICMRFRESCPGQKVQIRYYVSSIAEIKNTKGRLSFGSSSNRWKKNGS